MKKEKILIIDDEPDMLRGCQKFLETAGYAVVIAESGEDGLALFETENPDLTIVDLKMPGMDGMAVLQSIMARDQEAVVIVFTGYGTIESAVKAIRAGAFDFVQKPFDPDAFLIVIERALKLRCVREENIALKEMLDTRFRFENIIGNSEAITQVFDLMRKISDIDANVLITGESGTGKELVAQCIHANSKRSHKPFVPLNCGGLPENLVESEIFGHVKGAFTDAKQSRVGLIEHARGGTFFLDEIGELPMPLQVKFLRVLEDHKIRRLGSNQEIEIDIRLISATNQNIEALIGEGRFREDLFYRLNTFEIHLPPLRERQGDIQLLVHHFLNYFAETSEKAVQGISTEAMDVLCEYTYPGNVRELMHVMERAVALSDVDTIQLEDLPENLITQTEDIIGSAQTDLPFQDAKDAVIENFEQTFIDRLLKAHNGNVSRAARKNGTDRRTLQRLISKYAIDVSTYR
ncbi:MAG: sigma-54-dependent Fis family transcriptional regulator [Gemmatimonadetes bacterium]|nr:sigma-54-dependent Fis family transcriptional regulator [Gemmatimonadota bacterium]MYB58368.1 sigma-54-dependent Fis family transcriptional regulator [Gemmatimonadota bacterium]